MLHSGPETRRQILAAALRRFADAGYAATSVQQIVGDAKVSKPALYYYFQDKADLFRALVHEAHDERYRILCEAAARHAGIRAQLEAVLETLFDYCCRNRDLMRLSFGTMFTSPGERPEDLECVEKCERNFEFVHALIRAAQSRGELSRNFASQELAYGIYGHVNFYLVSHLIAPDFKPDRLTAQRIVKLFLAGAGAGPADRAGRGRSLQPNKTTKRKRSNLTKS
jgi:AcrR family transcriptional regulator